MNLFKVASGSSGNSIIAEIGGITLCFDCGIPYKKLCRKFIESFNKNPPNIDVILISHSHEDHIKYIKDYQKRHIDIIIPKDINRDWLYFRYIPIGAGETIPYNGLTIQSHKCYHDVPCLAYTVSYGDECLAYITDTGRIPETIETEKLTDLIIEENHDIYLLYLSYVNRDIDRNQYERILKYHLSKQEVEHWMNTKNFPKLKSVMKIHQSSRHYYHQDRAWDKCQFN